MYCACTKIGLLAISMVVIPETARHSTSSEGLIHSSGYTAVKSKSMKWDKLIADALKQPVTSFGSEKRECINRLKRQ